MQQPVFVFPGVRMFVPNLHETRQLLGYTLRVLADSNRTQDIIRGEELTGRAQLAHLTDEARAHPDGASLLRDRPELRDVDTEALRRLPAGTLGRALMDFLDANGLDFRVGADLGIYDGPTAEAYVARRIGKLHDLLHVLLGLGPAGHEEVLVHAFTLGQVGYPVSIAIVALGAIKHMVLEGRFRTLRESVLDAYELGRRVRPLHLVRWETLFATPLDDVRRTLGLHVIAA